jgi:DNA-binding NarL/FixJ family response regulator
MSVRAVVVAHRESLAAEGIAIALARDPALALVGVANSAAETERCAGRADAVAIDARIPGADEAVERLVRRGLRVVVIGGSRAADPDDGGIVVDLDAPVAQLARALAPGAPGRGAPVSNLSIREEEILRLASKGLAGKQIAKALGISPKTVEHHKTKAFRRLGVPNQAAAVALLAHREDRPWSPSTT